MLINAKGVDNFGGDSGSAARAGELEWRHETCWTTLILYLLYYFKFHAMAFVMRKLFVNLKNVNKCRKLCLCVQSVSVLLLPWILPCLNSFYRINMSTKYTFW